MTSDRTPTGAPETAPASRREEAASKLRSFIEVCVGSHSISDDYGRRLLAELALVSEPPARSSGSEAPNSLESTLEQLALDHIAIGADNATSHLSLAARQRIERSRDTKMDILRAALRSRSSSETGDEDTELLNGLEDLVIDSCGRKFIIGDPSTGNFACIETFGSAV